MGRQYRPHLQSMIRDIVHDADLASEFERGDREAIFERYGVTPQERSAFEQPSWEAFAELGIPPISGMTFMLASVTPMREHVVTLRPYLDRIRSSTDA